VGFFTEEKIKKNIKKNVREFSRGKRRISTVKIYKTHSLQVRSF